MMMVSGRFLVLGLACAFTALVVTSSPADAGGKAVDFTKQVKPILEKNCYGCHGTVKPGGGLDLTSKAALKRGGNSGKLFVAKKPTQSLLVKRLKGQGGALMPMGGPALKASEIQIVSKWITEGAKL